MITREQTKFTSSYSLKHRSLQTNEGQQHAKNGGARGLGGGGAEDNAATTVQTNWEVKKWAIPDLVFFIFVFLVQLTVNVQYNFLPMTGFKLRISGIGNDRFTNWATSITLEIYLSTIKMFINFKIATWGEGVRQIRF